MEPAPPQPPSAPAEAEAAFQQAVALHRQRRVDEARALYERALHLEPHHVPALICLSTIELQSTQPERAGELTALAARLAPDSGAVHFAHARAQHLLGRTAAAVASYERAIALNAGLADAHFHRGNALHALERYDAALASYEQALACRPGTAELFTNRGNTLRCLQRYGAALDSYAQAIAAAPNCAEAHYNRGITLAGLGRSIDAIASYERAIACRPQYAEAYFNRGNALRELGRLEAASASYQQALAVRPGYAEVYSNLGNLLVELGRRADALESYERALTLKPDFAEAHYNRGALLGSLQQLDAALDSLNDAIRADPHYAVAYLGRAFFSLLRGDLVNGWIDYEWRWKVKGSLIFQERRSFPQPRWHGEKAIAGKVILIHQEQGLGDALQFCRYVQQVADLGAKVILEIHRPLMDLLAQLAGVWRIIERGSALPAFDYWCPLLSLPGVFNTSLDTIPAAVRYLSADPILLTQWQSRLGDKTKPCIGIVWSGGKVHPNDHNRSMRLAQLLQGLPDGLEYVSLQNEVRDSDAQLLAQSPKVRSFAQHLSDFSDTAALCECMDLVISVDTSVAHLAGALGKSTWILLPFSPDWRWLLNRVDSPWYPTVRLYRQRSAGDWDAVLAQVRADLERAFLGGETTTVEARAEPTT